MSEPAETNVDLSVVQGTLTQLQELASTLGTVAGQLQSGGDLGWTGADDDGVVLYGQLNPAEQASYQAVLGAQQGVEGVIGNLEATAGIWKNTEDTNVDLNS